MNKPALVTLSDGHFMPQLGLGVWKAGNDVVGAAVQTALETGYRLIDTAAIYQNEEGVGEALKATTVPRDELFITTKLWNSDQQHAGNALEESLKKLQLDYVDLYLIHWPAPAEDHYVSAWEQLIELQKSGLTRSIGVCNFDIGHLQRIIHKTGVAPVLNQIELHPLLQQRELQAWNATHSIHTESWSPLAQGGEGVFDTDIIQALAAKYQKTPAQIVIRWHLDRGLIVIPKSVTPSRIQENFDVFDFRLEKEELSQIQSLDSGTRLGPDPKEFN
ncbi:2,5-didehydrogluconate reductase DkgA [Morganella morganii]|uniref:2,5-didehydrogluconate reductase DkgA n=1 Tax=Morganella morganii TaxID=582 RepID=UPI001C42A711|nr:2,5-didehydrogluconate reductase DkgA [Morganella morganii]MCU6376926.1 2,5-didehydrogluconate reductase DkgA [Morganella morganii]HBH7052537.1 2,5-didehydrogluconate reductase DkgA [Morganella morganii]HEI9845091.1 2,5-didehydrogluconate reductase DkgA [Morganella morganii]